MKKYILSLIALCFCMSINAQVIKVYHNDEAEPIVTYTNTASDKYKVVFEAPVDPNLLSGNFSVSNTKTVQFTKGNLYWDGSAFKFEANQTDYPTEWDERHVGHFYWTKTAAVSYAKSYSDDAKTTSDKFFCGEDNKITVEGTEGLYALSYEEWEYLIRLRYNAYSLYKYGVSVAGKTNCLIIAPDGYTGSIESSYDATAWATAEALGLVCLPAAGHRVCDYYNEMCNILSGGDKGSCWSSSPFFDENSARTLDFNSEFAGPTYNWRDNGCSIRLVK